MGEALSEYGFFYLVNHGIPTSLVDAQFAASKALFALPWETKQGLDFVQHLDIGYMGAGGQALDEESGVADTKEGFVLSNNAVMAGGRVDPRDPLAGSEARWPPVPDYEATMREWAAALYGLNARLNTLMFAAVNATADVARQPFFVVKQLRYGPSNNGAGAHADWGALTLLVTDDKPGLEVEYPPGEWLAVPPRPRAFVVNAGDQIAFWSNGRFKSANHRVRATGTRYSTAFFAYFDYHAYVVPLPPIDENGASCADDAAAGVTTGDYFAFKLCESIGLDKASCSSTNR